MLRFPAAAAQLRTDFDLARNGGSTGLAADVRPPADAPEHLDFAQSEVWKEHSAAMQSAWTSCAGPCFRMTAWRDAAISPTCPLGKTLHPFSGPDFFNAYWLFPDCETFVMFGLEHPGDVPDLESMNERQRQRLIADVRAATRDLFERNYFITENMARQLRTAHLRGVVPLAMISMTLSGLDILRIMPNEIARTSREEPKLGGRPLRQLKGVTIEFRARGSPKVQRMHYFSLDATDKGLAYYPEFLDYLRSLGPTTTFIKSASYLLHSGKFKRWARPARGHGLLVQDDSGLPYMAIERGWELQLHGRYDVPIPPFQGAFQAALDRAWKSRQPAPLPFSFGYQYHDQRDERSHVIIARKLPPYRAILANHKRGSAVRAPAPRQH